MGSRDRAASTSSPLQSAAAAAGDVKANYDAAVGRNGGGGVRTTTVSPVKTTVTRELGAF